MIKCKRCGEKFYKTKSLIEQAKYCSRKCVMNRVVKKCKTCKKKFIVPVCRIKTARFCSNKCIRHPENKKQICKNGHNKAVIGVNKWGTCKQCVLDYTRNKYVAHPLALVQFCPYGHDTFVTGRTRGVHGNCSACKQEYVTERLKEDLYFHLVCNLRSRIRAAIRYGCKKGSAVKDLGCSIKFFKKYIEKKFYGRITWDNYGKYWQLDHIIPLWKFDLTKRSQFLKAVNYKNLQPLTKPDHKKKTALETIELANLRRRRIS
jgi:hypothetical protein